MAAANDIRDRLLFGGVFSTVGLIVSVIGVAQLVEAIQSSSWPSTQGKVTESKVIRPGNGPGASFRTRVAYRYEVDGRAYAADRVRITGVSSSSDFEGHRRVVDRYPVGAQVAVHYKPGDPAIAALEPGVGSDVALLPVAGSIFAAIGLAILSSVLSLIRKRRAEEREAQARADAAGAPRIDLQGIPDPPPGLGLRLRRRRDSVIVSGMTTPEASEKATSPLASVIRAFSGGWVVLVGLMMAFGIVLCGAMLVLTVFGDAPFRFNGRPTSKPLAVAFTIGLGLFWVVFWKHMYRSARPISSLASGKAIAFPWTLELDGRRLTGRIDALGGSLEERISLIALRGLTSDDEGMLLVWREELDEPFGLIGPIEPAAARWLAEAFSRAIGPLG